MIDTPNSLRLSLAVAGRTNAGKSTLVNLIAGQDVAITSPVAGTTTDTVEKAMELWPVGPILLLDTAGLDDASELGSRRIERTRRAIDRADVLLLVVRDNEWGEPEQTAVALAKARKIETVTVFNRTSDTPVRPELAAAVRETTGREPLNVRATDPAEREKFLPQLKAALLAAGPEDFFTPPPLLSDLVEPADLVVLLVPVDVQAPKGRLILPQVQTIRDALDCGAVPVVCKETEYEYTLNQLKRPPALVVCDSQVSDLMVRLTPAGVPCTTFSILFARLKGDIAELMAGARTIETLRPGDPILIAEACTHHATDIDIGRVKIPRWLAKKVGGELDVTVSSGRDYPTDLARFKLVIHCGGCMLNRRETLHRIALARAADVPITNYGMAIAACHGILERVTMPFR